MGEGEGAGWCVFGLGVNGPGLDRVGGERCFVLGIGGWLGEGEDGGVARGGEDVAAVGLGGVSWARHMSWGGSGGVKIERRLTLRRHAAAAAPAGVVRFP